MASRLLFIGRNDELPHNAASAGAFIYDATCEQWLSRPSVMTADARATGDLSRSKPRSPDTPALRKCSGPTALQSPVASLPQGAAGTWLDLAQDVVTTVSGVIVFCGLALFLLVLA